MIVAVTGGTGAVGARLVERHLRQGDIVRVLSRRAAAAPAGVEAFQGDLAADGPALARFANGADILYHCAAETRDTARMTEVNVEGTRRLVRAARGSIGRWVQLGSVAVYGTPRAGVITEDTPASPVTVYGHGKAAADGIVMEAAAGGAFSCAILRPAKIFGAGLEGGNTAILRRLIGAIDKGLFFFIGPPGAVAHYAPVDGVVEALTLCGRSGQAANRAYNLSDDRTMETFVGAIAAALGRACPSLRLPEAPVRLLAKALGWMPGFPLTGARVEALTGRADFSGERIARELGYRPPVTVEQALRELVADWKRKD